MTSEVEFREELRRYLGRQPSKIGAARALGITRQDLHRYATGVTAPRADRRRKLMSLMRAKAPPPAPSPGAAQALISAADVAQLRDALLHLVTLVELDLATRRGDERKDG